MLGPEKNLLQPNSSQNRKNYLKYTVKMRLQLIRLVCQESFSIAEAARQVGIKQTSACRIMASYRNHNRIFQRKTDRALRQKTQNLQDMQKIHGSQEKSELKSEADPTATHQSPPQSLNSSQQASDPESETVRRQKNLPQLIIPTPCLPEISTNPHNSWNTLLLGQNLVWSWPLCWPYY